MESACTIARDQLAKAGMLQKRNYDTLVWVFSLKRRKGPCLKLDSNWVGPCRVMERVGELVSRVQLPPQGRRVVLHGDRLDPYRGSALPSFMEEQPKPPPAPLDESPRNGQSCPVMSPSHQLEVGTPPTASCLPGLEGVPCLRPITAGIGSS